MGTSQKETAASNPAASNPKAPSGHGSYASSSPTRSKILDAAAKVFARSGFEGTSLRGVAKVAGVDHSTLMHHFRDKETLLCEVLRARDIEYVPEEATTVLTARALVDHFVKIAELGQADPEASQLFSNMSAEAAVDGHPARAYLQERHQALLTVLGEAVRAQRAAGNLEENGLSPRQEAARLVSAWEGHEVFARLHPGLIDVPKLWQTTLRAGLGLTGGEEGSVIHLDPAAFAILEP